MSGGPPLGHPWHTDIGHTPTINRDPPPPPLNAAPGGGGGGGHSTTQTIVEHHQAPIYGPPVPIGIAPPFGVGLGLGTLPPFMDPFLLGGGPLAPIRAGSFLPGAHAGIGFGLHAGGMPFPPPPPGALAGGVVPAFAPTAPLWAPGIISGGGGLAFGNMPAAAVAGGGVPFGGLNLLAPHQRPAPIAIDGNHGGAPQPAQGDPTTIPGGVPPGATHIESAEHTLWIQIKGTACPWLSPGASFVTEVFHIGSSTGLNRLIQVCADNAGADECENMAVTECIELGNGLWEKGQTFKYDDAVSRVLTMKDAGWDNKRNRAGGQSLHLWLHRV
jgi:hypothetical protein